jgi:hypothetical protein
MPGSFAPQVFRLPIAGKLMAKNTLLMQNPCGVEPASKTLSLAFE